MHHSLKSIQPLECFEGIKKSTYPDKRDTHNPSWQSGKKADLQIVAEEVGVAFSEEDTRIVLKKKIMGSKNYEEEGIMELANAIVTERVEREKLEAEKLRMEHELEMQKLKIQESANHTNGARERNNETIIERFIKSVKTLSKHQKGPRDIICYLTIWNGHSKLKMYRKISRLKFC